MKKYIVVASLLFGGIAAAQTVQPKLEAFGDMVKATYYHDNGQVQQTGFFKDGKLDGQWVAYDLTGAKIAVAEYDNGSKTGKWIFWNDTKLSEVTYADSRVASVKTWTQEVLANRN